MSKAASEADNTHKLFISIELNRSCNLRCPYCYQGNEKKNSLIPDEAVALVVRYCELVSARQPYSELYLKILGGEPTLAPDRFKKTNDEIGKFCNRRGIKYHLLVDTNGTQIDMFGTLVGYDSLLFTIPLTHKSCHDVVRRRMDGSGTYDAILENVNKLNAGLPHAKIILRHNTDSKNMALFDSYLDDIKEKCEFNPWISLNYTADLNDNSFESGLSYRDFVKWSSSAAIESLLNHGLPVLMSPLSSIEECQYRSRYSLKVFSDLTVGKCAMEYGKENRVSLEELVREMEEGVESRYFREKDLVALVTDRECMECDELFLCGGTKKLPCIQAVDNGFCGYSAAHNIDIESFVRTYFEAKERGLGELFVVFEGKEGYR